MVISPLKTLCFAVPCYFFLFYFFASSITCLVLFRIFSHLEFEVHFTVDNTEKIWANRFFPKQKNTRATGT